MVCFGNAMEMCHTSRAQLQSYRSVEMKKYCVTYGLQWCNEWKDLSLISHSSQILSPFDVNKDSLSCEINSKNFYALTLIQYCLVKKTKKHIFLRFFNGVNNFNAKHFVRIFSLELLFFFCLVFKNLSRHFSLHSLGNPRSVVYLWIPILIKNDI